MPRLASAMGKASTYYTSNSSSNTDQPSFAPMAMKVCNLNFLNLIQTMKDILKALLGKKWTTKGTQQKTIHYQKNLEPYPKK